MDSRRRALEFHGGIYQLKWLTMIVLTIQVISSVVLGLPDHITPKEQEAIDKFRPIVEKHLTHDFQKSDAYLVTWLRTKKLNLNDAEKLLMKSLEWKKKNKIEDGANADWTKFKQYDLVYTAGVDRKGNPIIFSRYGSWDLRKAVLAGQADQLMSYIHYHGMEAPMRRSFEKSVAAGRNASIQSTMLVDMSGYTLRNGGCLGCVPITVNWPTTYEANYPQIYDKILVVNTPAIFESVLAIIRPLLSQYTREDLIILGTGKESWEKELDKWISKDQLPKTLGGKKNYH